MRRNIRLLEIQDIMLSALFIMPVLVPYFHEKIGLSFQEFLFVEAIFSFTVIALGVPSGWISDIWKRKSVLALSCVFWIIALIILVIANNLFMAILSMIIFGVAVSLLSGTNSALLYDTLLILDETDQFARLEGRRKGFSFYALAGASLLGGFLYEINIELPIILGICTAIIGLVATLFMLEPPRNKSAVQHNPIADMLITMRYALHGHKIIGIIIIFSTALFGATKIIMWIQQPYYMALEIPEAIFGVLAAIGFGLAGLASHLNHIISASISNLSAIIIALLLAMLICLVSAFYTGYHGVILLMFGGSFIFGAIFPRVQDAINKRVGSERRATILSTANLSREAVFIPLSLIVGWGIGALI